MIGFHTQNGQAAVHVEALASHLGCSRGTVERKLGWLRGQTESPVLGRTVERVYGTVEITTGFRANRRGGSRSGVRLDDATGFCEALGKPWPEDVPPAENDHTATTGHRHKSRGGRKPQTATAKAIDRLKNAGGTWHEIYVELSNDPRYAVKVKSGQQCRSLWRSHFKRSN